MPEALLVRVEAPGQLGVYQGEYLVASLHSGRIRTTLPIGDLLGAHPLFSKGQDLLRREIISPKHETPRQWHTFEWLAYANTILAVVNSIQLSGHGGSLIFAGNGSSLLESGFVKVKYRISSDLDQLRRHFVEFMNMRYKLGDMLWLLETEDEDAPAEQECRLIEYLVNDAQRALAEACSFVGNLSGTDGALILRTDLSVEGFGAEILLDKVKDAKVYEIKDPFMKYRKRSKKGKTELDSEQFGMRHRSAMRLCAAIRDLVIFVVSQDGGVSLVWNEDGEVYFQSGIRIVNMNMVFA